MTDSRLTASDRWFLLVFIFLTAVNVLVVLFSPFDLSPDETHYVEWSRHIDWAYYSKGPAVAVLIKASTMLFGETPFAVRLPAIACYAFFSILFYVFVRQLMGPRTALAAWLASRSLPIFAQMGVLMTTDAPAALLWLVALVCAHRAVVEEESPYWVGFGAAVGLGVLAKYTVAFLYPSIFLLLFLTPHLRRHLIHPAFIAGTVVCLFVIFPILKWNAEHAWVNFQHNASHVANSKSSGLRPHFFFELLFGQIGFVGPLIFFGIFYSFAAAYREWKSDDRVAALLLFSSAPLAIFVALVSFTKRAYANWPLPIYIGGLLLLAYLIAHYRIVSPRVTRLIKPGILLSAGITVIAHLAFLGCHFWLPSKMLPTKKLAGWHELGAGVDKVLADYKKSAGENAPQPFIFTDSYEIASEIAFYSKERPRVYNANLDGRRMNQYDIWDGWHELTGQNALIVLKEERNQEAASKYFSSVKKLPDTVPVVFAGDTMKTFEFSIGSSYNGVHPPQPEKR